MEKVLSFSLGVLIPLMEKSIFKFLFETFSLISIIHDFLSSQRTFTDLNSLNHNPAYNLQHSLTSQPQSNGSITTFSPMSQSNGPTTLQRPHPPPPPSRDSTLSRGDQLQQAQHHTLQARPSASAESSTGAAQAHTSPPSKPSEETNGVSLVSQQELDFNSKVVLMRNIQDFN